MKLCKQNTLFLDIAYFQIQKCFYHVLKKIFEHRIRNETIPLFLEFLKPHLIKHAILPYFFKV